MPWLVRKRLLQRIVHRQLFQYFGLTGLPDLPGQEHLVHRRVHFVEVEHQVKLAHVVEVLIENLYKVMDGLQVVEVVVVDVHTDTEVEAGVPPVDNLEVSELHKVCVLRVPHSDDWNFSHELLLI